METYGHLSAKKTEEISATQMIQTILDELGRVTGVRKALLVTEEGFPIMSARTSSISEEVETIVSAMVAGIVSTFSGACVQLDLGKEIDYIHVQTPLGLGLISKVNDIILVIITGPDVKLGLMHYLICSTKAKIQKLQYF
ncbi:MAG: roadblock/LC7 domain-containing protein [Candidatus Hodarchaeales archaeon]